MRKQAYRMLAPRQPHAVAVARARDGTGHNSLVWIMAGLVSLALLFATDAARAQVRLAAAPDPSTADYVRQSAVADQFAIASSRVALEKSQNPEVRDFARQMMSDYGLSTAELKQAMKDGKVMMTVPVSLDPQRERELQVLRKKAANQFDQAYLQSQLQGHRNALDMQRAYAQMGDNAALKRYASQATPIVQSHLARLEVVAQNSFAARMCQAGEAPAAVRDRPG